MEEFKLFEVKMIGDKLVLSLDTDKDGKPVADLNIYSLEGVKEVMAAVSKAFSKK